MDSDGLINEFALLYSLRMSFPLHFTLFKQVSSHLCHEANTEQLFLLAGNLSDDNGKMDPYRLSVWVSIAANWKNFQPSTQVSEHDPGRAGGRGAATLAQVRPSFLFQKRLQL